MRKRRPLVVVTADEIGAAQEIAAVAITTTFREPLPPDHVQLPWDPTGRASTGLRRRSAAVCSWVVAIRKDDIEASGGYVPAPTLLEIVTRLPKP